jgi:hypothetical protein
MAETFYEFTREKAAKTREMLRGAFIWGDTDDGFDYWSEVSIRLNRIANCTLKEDNYTPKED